MAATISPTESVESNAPILMSIVNFVLVALYAILRPSIGIIFEPLTRHTGSKALVLWKLWFAHYFAVFTFVLYLLSTVLLSMNSYVATPYRTHLRAFVFTSLVSHVGCSLAVDSFVAVSKYASENDDYVLWSLWAMRPVIDAVFATAIASITVLTCYSRRDATDMDFELSVVGSLITALSMGVLLLIPIEIAYINMTYYPALILARMFNAFIVISNVARALRCYKHDFDCNDTLYNLIIFTSGVITVGFRDIILCNE